MKIMNLSNAEPAVMITLLMCKQTELAAYIRF